MTEIPHEQPRSEPSTIHSRLHTLLDRLPCELDAADEYTRQRTLTPDELELAKGIFLGEELAEPLEVSLMYQQGSLEPNLAGTNDMQSEIAAIHVATDMYDVIYGFYKTPDGAYYTDRSVQSYQASHGYTSDVLKFAANIAGEELIPEAEEELFENMVAMPLITGEVKPSIQELRALARLVEDLRTHEEK